MERIRHWSSPEKTRIVLDMGGDCIYRVSEREAPDRIVIDIPGGQVAGGVGRLEVDDGVVSRIRVNRLSRGAQVVVDLPGKTPYAHFALDPNDVHPRHRIVIDVKKVLSVGEQRRRIERAEAVARSGDVVVIIDPGHGGSQPGAPSRYGPPEKSYTLPLSRMIAEEIERHPGFTAVLTRNGDYDVAHYNRVRIAREHGGHCFVSVHLNGNEDRRLRGSEVYFLSPEGASDLHSVAVAERENMQLELENQGEEIDDDVGSILFEMRRNYAMDQSSVLAEHVADRLEKVGSIPFRDVRQAKFLVLRGISMPSILVEAAYLSNKRDATEMKKHPVQRAIARAVADGVVSYLLANPPEGRSVEETRIATHVVSSGETLWGISRRYNCRIDEIRQLNGLGNGSRIRPGQRLRVYAKGR